MKSNYKIYLSTLRHYTRALRQDRYLFVLAAGLGLLANVIHSVIIPYLYSQVFDVIAGLKSDITGVQINHLWQLLGFIGLGLTAILVLWRAVTYIYVINQARIMRYLERQVFDKLQQHSYNFFSNRFGGALVTQANRFINGFMTVQDETFWALFMMFTRVAIFSVILLIVFPPVGLALSVWTVIFLAIIALLNIYKGKYSRASATADSRVTAELADNITNITNVKVFAKSRYEQQRFYGVSQDRYKKRLKSWFWDEHLRAMQSLLMILLEFFVIYWSIRASIDGTVSVGVLLLSNYYVFRVFSDFWEFGNITRRLEKAISEATEMTEILDQTVEVKDPKTPEKLSVQHGEIQFENVKFSYGKAHGSVFSKLNLQIEPGEKVGLVGPSGGGKTTLTKILLRFADIDSGAIKIDGQNIAEVTQDNLRSQIAYVPQEPILFHRSIAENIRYGNPEATDEEIYEAARLAHAAEFIKALPDGYDTMVGERGMKLSGGQKQRVAIARAMLVKAPILLLDEATSALDSKSEKLIADALDSLMKNRTTIVIAHRLSTIRKLDKIIVMQQGEIAETGTHEQLLKTRGLYAELWSHQSGDFLDE